MVIWISKDSINSASDLKHALSTVSGEIVLIASEEIRHALSDEAVVELLDGTDVVHSGLSFGGADAFNSVQLCAFNWHFLNGASDRPSVSWKATLDFTAFEKHLVDVIGAVDDKFVSANAALMDFVYRALVAGGKTIYRPLSLGMKCNGLSIPSSDEAYFVSKHFSKGAYRFFQFSQFILTGKIVSARLAVNDCLGVHSVVNEFKLTSTVDDTSIKVDSYSALIPTIDRYDYIGKSIRSLLSLSFPPAEILVVDQTSSERRRSDIYDEFMAFGIVKIIFVDKPGQCTARNIGLSKAQFPWILLFEDDAEAWPDMVDEHINLLKRSGCDVSTGVVVPPGADREFIPRQNRRYFLSDIFTTGNAFMRVATAFEVGGFDPRFDFGPGADDDFGKRLYLAGKLIVYNYRSVETHHKAPSGGMRVHGIWWRNKSSFLGSYPPATQAFSIMKYYESKFRSLLFLSMILKARKRYSLPGYFLFLMLLPFKIIRSIRQAKALMTIPHDGL